MFPNKPPIISEPHKADIRMFFYESRMNCQGQLLVNSFICYLGSGSINPIFHARFHGKLSDDCAECHSVLVDRMAEKSLKNALHLRKKTQQQQQQQQHNDLARVEKTPCWIFISNRSDHTRASLWNAAEALKSLRAATLPDHISARFLNFFLFYLLAGCFAAACDCWTLKKNKNLRQRKNQIKSKVKSLFENGYAD